MRRWLSVLAVVASSAGVAWFLYHDHAIKSERAAVEAELDVSDPGWRLADIEAARRKIPDAQNSALVVRKLSRVLPGSVFGWNIGRHERALRQVAPNERLNDALHQVLCDALVPLAKERELALGLKDLPDGRFPIRYTENFMGTDISEQQASRVVRQFLYYDAMLRAEETDMASALLACRALLHAGRAIGDEPMVLSQLERLIGQELTVRAVERVLAQGETGEADLKGLQERLDQESRATVLRWAFRGVRGGTGAMYAAFDEEPARTVSVNYTAQLRYLTRVIEACKLPAEQQLGAVARIEATRNELPELARQLVPTVSSVTEVGAQAQASLRSAIVAIAAERYRLLHHEWPARSADLVTAGLLKEVPADPFDGQPLRWRLLDDGAVAYSTSYDKVDNQGALERTNPTAPQTDLGMRLWNVKARRQPPAR